MSLVTVRGSIPEIIRNDAGLYEGNLRYYYWVTWQFAKNLMNLYHGFGHVFHVVYRVWDACNYYKASLTPQQMRTVLLAALFHDWNHPGVDGDDDLNIKRAIRGLRKHCLNRDIDIADMVAYLIETTEYPYREEFDTSKIGLLGQILRDADMMQSLGPVWMQPVIFGLAGEWNKPPLEVLKIQPGFVGGIKLHTTWAQALFSQDQINAKRAEAQEHLELATIEPPRE